MDTNAVIILNMNETLVIFSVSEVQNRDLSGLPQTKIIQFI